MQNNINKIIDSNLKLMADDPDINHVADLLDEKGSKYDIQIGTRFLKMMEAEDLLSVFGEYFVLRSKGSVIANSGGWLKYLDKQTKKEKQERKMTGIKFYTYFPLLIIAIVTSYFTIQSKLGHEDKAKQDSEVIIPDKSEQTADKLDTLNLK